MNNNDIWLITAIRNLGWSTLNYNGFLSTKRYIDNFCAGSLFLQKIIDSSLDIVPVADLALSNYMDWLSHLKINTTFVQGEDDRDYLIISFSIPWQEKYSDYFLK
jgi:hypothetical protein